MRRFVELVDALAAAPHDAARARRLAAYLAATPDPERGWALGVLLGRVRLPGLSFAALRDMARERIDPTLLDMAHAHVGTLTEAVALAWPGEGGDGPAVADIVSALAGADPTARRRSVAGWLDRLNPAGRRVLLQLLCGRARPLVGAAALRGALATLGHGDGWALAAVLDAAEPPYGRLLTGEGNPTATSAGPLPFHLIRRFAAEDAGGLDPAALQVEWMWAGRRVQLVAVGGQCALYDSSGETLACPLAGGLGDVTLEGVLMETDGAPAMWIHDLLRLGGEDLRRAPLRLRRARLESWFAPGNHPGLALSPCLALEAGPLAALRDAAPPTARGVMLKAPDDAYGPGHPSWIAWPQAPCETDLVLMYGSFAGPAAGGLEVTVGAWDGEGRLVPVGRIPAPSGPSLRAELETWIRANTAQRHGPVREVPPHLVLRVAHAGVERAPRRKAGFILVEPVLRAILWDAGPGTAARLDELRPN